MTDDLKRLCHPGRLALALAIFTAACAGTPGDPDGGPMDASTPDAGAADANTRWDGGGFVGLGRRCTSAEDCLGSGFCLAGPTGQVCSYRCDGECPEGWACRVADVGEELVSVCLPIIPPLCSPCSGDEQCPGGACIELLGEGFCVAICFEGSCPIGYECGEDPSGTRPHDYCLPATGSCSCTYETDGAMRTCSNENEVGTCWGVETCVATEGWTGCDARAPELEVCDGADNDCDFVIDDGVDGVACTNDVAGVGSCPGLTLCMGASGVVCQGPTPALELCNYVDDDCDGTIDDGFTGLGGLCNAGVGACLRQGVIRCTADQAATECSAVVGAPLSETCNGIDDDCDGEIDEDFPTLGGPCSGGVGLCSRVGSLVCAASGAGTACSVSPGTPGPEVCNSLDDDCDGQADEDFRDASGAYNRHTACGSCGVDCTAIYGLPNAFGTCDLAGGARCVMSCSPSAFDLNAVLADGCEFLLDPAVIYVSISDAAAVDDATCGLGPVGTGAGHYPCRTIAQGLLRAGTTGRSRVLVANGLYDEPVTLVNGKSLLGGYRPDTWERDLGATGTQIRGVASTGIHQYTVRAIDITAPTLFEGFVVRGSVNGTVAGNSYAIYVSGSSSNLTIRGNVVYSGRGGPGDAGGIGGAGTAGVDGIGRDSAGVNAATYDALSASGAGNCATSNNRQHTNGGARTCGTDVVSGGNGGGNRCPPSTTRTKYSAIDGLVGQPGDGTGGGAAGAGGVGGYDSTLARSGSGSVCYIPSDASGDPIPTYGADGAIGRPGSHGASGAGCSTPAGSVSSGHWLGSTGASGAVGRSGGGGGGGGAGGGAYCSDSSCTSDRLGGHGGGGGSGGCGGGGGNPGRAGGAAFGIFIVGGASAPLVTSNSIVRGEGGPGGGGGSGGAGGSGGTGAAGGTSTVFCAGPAGRGGNGGNGGHGAGGGGGCGGASYGIYSSGLGATTYCGAGAANTFSGGAGGAGGPGGYSLGNTGSTGGDGSLLNCGSS